jgi:hypothetical protein
MTKAPLITLGCVVALCGVVYVTGGTEDAHELTSRGLQQLARGEYGAAADNLARAADALHSGAPDYDRAHRGLVDALAHVDAKQARIEFLAYAEAAAELDAGDYRSVAATIHKTGSTAAAAQVLDAALLRFPDEAGMLEAQKAKFLEEAQKTGTPEEVERLRGLGYTSG